MNLYRCPFCNEVIRDSIAALIEHRREGGECNKLTAEGAA